MSLLSAMMSRFSGVLKKVAAVFVILLCCSLVSQDHLGPQELVEASLQSSAPEITIQPDDVSYESPPLADIAELREPEPFAAAVANPASFKDFALEHLGEQPVNGEQFSRATEADDAYGARVFWSQAKSIPWRFGGAAAAITATGFANWNWGSSRFKIRSEGLFGKETSSLGMDKLGHAYSSYVLTEFFTDGIRSAPGEHRSSSYTAGLLAMGLMAYIEVFDGFSKDHGFSYEDLAFDAAGAMVSVARRSIPGLRDKLDFRLLYTPSKSTFRSLSCFPAPHCDRDGQAARTPITDYRNQRYLLALKFSGFEKLRRTPLRLVEIQGGYYARGFTAEEEAKGDVLRRRLFLGIGLNVSELVFPSRSGRAGRAGRAVRSALEYLQVPYAAIYSQ